MTPLPDKVYRTILADPPWPEYGGGSLGVPRGANRHYELMDLDSIYRLPVAKLADPVGCHLYLWTTNSYMWHSFKVMASWGFRHITVITWAKNRIGLGQYFRGQTEHCMFGCSGRPLGYRKRPDGKRVQGRTLITALVREHSRKPDQLMEMAEEVSHPPRIELFSRHSRVGWDSWGLQIQSTASAMSEVLSDGVRPGPVLPAQAT